MSSSKGLEKIEQGRKDVVEVLLRVLEDVSLLIESLDSNLHAYFQKQSHGMRSWKARKALS